MKSIRKIKTDQSADSTVNSGCYTVAELCDAYFDRLYSLIFNQVGKDHRIAEYIAQETFVTAMESSGKLSDQNEVFTWLCSIAYRKVCDFYRSRDIEDYPNYRKGILNKKAKKNQDDELPPLNLTEAKELYLTANRQVLSDLPLDYQCVLLYRHIEALSIKEISQIMNRSVKSVEELLSRAQMELRGRLIAHIGGK